MSSQWVDVHGNLWRYSRVAGLWQTRVNGYWSTAVPPSGGLSKISTTTTTGNVIVVETTGPTGASGPPGTPGTLGVSISEVLPAEYQDGVNDTFPLSVSADLSQAFQVFRNGLLEIQGHGYLVTPTHVTFTTPPLDSDVLTVVYQKAQ